MKVTQAVMQKPGSDGGASIVQQVGQHLADKLAAELAAHLQDVMPVAIIRTIGDDMLDGGDNIAAFLFGSAEHRKKVYRLAETGRLPVARLGKGQLYARKSTLVKWIEAQEARCNGGAADVGA